MSYNDTLQRLRREGNLRRIPEPGALTRGVVDFSLNDYLGLGSRRDLQDEFFAHESNRRIAMTASAARLLAADQDEFHRLEEFLGRLYPGREALMFNSGYHANTGLISALASEPGTMIVADKLAHASMIDGMVLSRTPFRRFIHNDFDHLERIIAREAPCHERILVAVEAVYSMDGDRTDLDLLVELKRRYGNVMLYVDEAHSFGVLGQQGLGLCRSHSGYDEIDIVVGTLGKAAASTGAFAVMSPTLRHYAVNRARSFIFSTAIPPLNCAWSRFMIGKLTAMDAERRHLHRLAERLSHAVGLPDTRYIVPFMTGSAESALAASAQLLRQGLKVLPIRTPTVRAGTERLRISLSAAMSEAQIDRLTEALDNIRP